MANGLLKIKQQARGTRILIKDYARKHRAICDALVAMADAFGAEEIQLPIVEPLAIYNRAGEEALRHLYSFQEPATGKSICLRPEGTVTCQIIAETAWKERSDVKIFYVTKCWRHERPQMGRYYEFTQFGVEILNPRKPEVQPAIMMELAKRMITIFTARFNVSLMKRKYAYYTGEGFEIHCEQLGAQKQVCGGGPYNHGYGFAIHVDRVMLL